MIPCVCHVTSTSNKLIEQYHDVFEGLGCIGEEYHIEVDKTIHPVQHVPRRVPVAMKDRLKHKLDQLTKSCTVIKPNSIQAVPDSNGHWLPSMTLKVS